MLVAAVGVGVDWIGLLGPFLLHLQYSVLLGSLIPCSHLIVLTLHILHHHLDLYVIDIVSADLRKPGFFEPLGAESGLRTVMLPHLRGTGVREGDVGRLAGDSIGVFELYLVGGTLKDGGLIGPEADPFGGWGLTNLLVEV